ncbi:ABC transporter permease [Streptomyces sp. NPDC127068]|uniref:ABC transporter permease n=1 Tax=Streptomyces sp. NPDC127068 TaxID=3347127 RepID=UPI003656AB79
MNPSAVALRAGLHRGWIEFRQNVSNSQDIWGAVFPPAVSLAVMYILRDNTVPGTDASLGSQAVPGILAMNAMLTGLMGLAIALTMDREDSTLLRAKAVPNGVLGYLTGKVVSRAAVTAASLFAVLVPASFLFGGLELGRAMSWVTLTWVLALGLLATLPLGAILGSLFNSAQSMSFTTLPLMGLVAISGVFYPINGFPDWLQWLAQVFPVYWLALGLRSALLPDELAAAEIGESWRHAETLGVLGLWAALGFLLAPVVLSRMARRESGSSVAARRAKAEQRPM